MDSVRVCFKPWEDEEIWKDVPNFEGLYQVSNLGRVKSLVKLLKIKGGALRKTNEKILKPFLNADGYSVITLYKNRKRKFYLAHRLIWETFNGEVPKGYEINHISECKTDNRLSNLNLLTHKANCNWGSRNERIGEPQSKSVIQKSLDGKIIRIWHSANEIKRELGFGQGNICMCCKGKYKQAYGYIWQYIEKAAS